MLRFRSLSIKLSVSLFRADKIDLFCYLYFSKFSMLCQRLSAKYYMHAKCNTYRKIFQLKNSQTFTP